MAMFGISKTLFRRFYCYSYRRAIIGRQTSSSYLWTDFVCRFDSNQLRCYSNKVKWITIFLEKADGTLLRRKGKVGVKLHDTLQGDPDFPDYGVCQGLQACATCHVIFTKEDFVAISKYKSEFEEAENDLLDDIVGKHPSGDAEFRTDTSRLGCCFELVPEMDGMVIKIPKTKSVVDT